MTLSPLVLHQTFDSFLRGAENADAYQLATEFCSHTEGLNPCLIIGPSGEGKTHLLQAVVRNLWRQGKGAILFSASHNRNRIPITPEVNHILVDDLSVLLSANSVEARHRIYGINKSLESGKRFLMACAGSSDVGSYAAFKGFWPNAEAAEILPSGLDLRVKLAAQVGQHIPAKMLFEIAKASRSLREVEGWIIRYEACMEMGEPFDINEGY